MSPTKVIQNNLLPSPSGSSPELAGILIPEDQLRTRIRELAVDLNQTYQQESVVVIGVLKGAILFFSDLIRELQFPVEVDFLGISSYGGGTESGEAVVNRALTTTLSNRNVIIVDDILDGGQTLGKVVELVRAEQPKSMATCVLLERTDRRAHDITADYVGFRIPDAFVIGYGLDYAERFRNLPFIGVLNQTHS